MNKPLPRKLTGNPDRASKITGLRDLDCTQGTWFTRDMPLAGELGKP